MERQRFPLENPPRSPRGGLAPAKGGKKQFGAAGSGKLFPNKSPLFRERKREKKVARRPKKKKKNKRKNRGSGGEKKTRCLPGGERGGK